MALENCQLTLTKQKYYEFSFASVIGTRQKQEDYFGIITSEKSIAACVCDGMGGLDFGALASEIAVTRFIDEIAKNIDSCSSETDEFFLDLVDKLDHDVHRIKNADGSKSSAGCTLVSVFISDNEMKWLSVGDSTIYRVRNGEITRLNKYHNYQARLDEQLSLGQISKTDYLRESVKGHSLTSYVGMGGITIFDMCNPSIQLESNDMIVLCSDGITDYVSQTEMAASMNEKSAKKAVDDLMNVLFSKSKEKALDNTTLITIKIK